MQKINFKLFLYFYCTLISFSLLNCEISKTFPTTTFSNDSNLEDTEAKTIISTIEILKENETKIPREAANELPNPGEIADPSLVPVHLEKPEYRPLVANNPMPVVTENPKLEEETSSTILNLSEGEKENEEKNKIIEEIITTTPTINEGGEQIETTEIPKGEEQKGKENEEEKNKEVKEEEEKPKEEGDEVKEEDKNVEETTTTTTTIETSTTQEEEKEEEENQNTNNINEEEIIKLMSEALKRSNLAIQNVTLILPGDANPTLIQTFLQTLLASNRPLNEQPNINLENTIQPVPLFPSNQFYPPANIPPQAVYPTITTIHQQHPTRPTYLIQVEQLNDWITSGKNIKILDASYDPEPPINHVKFYSEYYAKWDKLLAEKRNIQYERSHIEGAISFNLNIATYPSWNERQALYSPELFQQYIQRLGIDQNDQLVIYGRGPIGGMLQSARVWFLFRIYGHENVGIIDGGFEALKNSGLIEITNGTTETSLGNWTAKFRDDLLSTFEELTTADIYGYCILSRINWYNFLDGRPRNEFFGLSGIYDNQRGHLTGSKSFPADELVNPKGFLLSKEEILAKLTQIGYNRNYQTIIFGNTADEASIILLALAIVQDTKAKLYNGGMEEIRRRAPYLINLK